MGNGSSTQSCYGYERTPVDRRQDPWPHSDAMAQLAAQQRVAAATQHVLFPQPHHRGGNRPASANTSTRGGEPSSPPPFASEPVPHPHVILPPFASEPARGGQPAPPPSASQSARGGQPAPPPSSSQSARGGQQASSRQVAPPPFASEPARGGVPDAQKRPPPFAGGRR